MQNCKLMLVKSPESAYKKWSWSLQYFLSYRVNSNAVTDVRTEPLATMSPTSPTGGRKRDNNANDTVSSYSKVSLETPVLLSPLLVSVWINRSSHCTRLLRQRIAVTKRCFGRRSTNALHLSASVFLLIPCNLVETLLIISSIGHVASPAPPHSKRTTGHGASLLTLQFQLVCKTITT